MEIQLSISTVKEEYGCVDHARVLLDTAKSDSARRLSDALSCTEQECANLCALIVQVQADIEIEKRSVVAEIEKMSDLDRWARELTARRDDRLRRLAEETKAFLVELEKRKQVKRWEFEHQQEELLAAVKTETESNKAADFQRFTEFNMNLSQRNCDLEDLSRQNRTIIAELRHEQRALLDFWNEKLGVATAHLNSKKVAFSEHRPRPLQQEKIDGLHSIAQVVVGKHREATTALADMKIALAKQENALNKRFGKRPTVGVVRSYPSAVV
jgi:hypothetical protein